RRSGRAPVGTIVCPFSALESARGESRIANGGRMAGTDLALQARTLKPVDDLAVAASADLFRHVTADKAGFYRAIMAVFAAGKRQYRLQLRPEEVLAEADWPGQPPAREEVAAALAQLTDWGNLESQ